MNLDLLILPSSGHNDDQRSPVRVSLCGELKALIKPKLLVDYCERSLFVFRKVYGYVVVALHDLTSGLIPYIAPRASALLAFGVPISCQGSWTCVPMVPSWCCANQSLPRFTTR